MAKNTLKDTLGQIAKNTPKNPTLKADTPIETSTRKHLPVKGVTVYLTADEHRRLKHMATDFDTTCSAILASLLREFWENTPDDPSEIIAKHSR